MEVDELIYDIFSGHTVVNIPQGVFALVVFFD